MPAFFLFISGVVLMGAVGNGHAANVQIDPDGILKIEGQRRFLLGMYENPKSDDDLKALAEAGFQMVMATPDPESLTRLQQYGLYGWVNLGMLIDFSRDRENREKELRDLISRVGKHPALLVWEIPDEVLWNIWYQAVTWRLHEQLKQITKSIDAQAVDQQATYRARLEEATRCYQNGFFARGEELADDLWVELGGSRSDPNLNLSNAEERAETILKHSKIGCDLLRELDPIHPVWMNHAPRNSIRQLAAFNQLAHIVGCDIYPVPPYKVGHSDLADKHLTAVGAYTRRMQEAAPGKPVWMVLQGFAWRDLGELQSSPERDLLVPPTLEETRFMAFDAIVNGAKGILYWGSAYIPEDSNVRADVYKVVKELSDLQPFLTAQPPQGKVQLTWKDSWGSIDRGVAVLAREVNGEPWFLVVNEWAEPLTYTLEWDGLAKYPAFEVIHEGMTIPVDGKHLSYPIRGFGIHLLRPVQNQS